ncbi:MAG TPA: DUF2393 family protein [Acidobacteriaceae bacterium]|nr:DUF2393 family protein [Acidobacteriaceae bacterium]
MSTDPTNPGDRRDAKESQDAHPAPVSEMFSAGRPHDEEQGRSWLPWIVAAAIVLVGLGLLAFFGGKGAPSSTPQDATLQPSPYAASLRLANLHLSQAANFAGGQVTYVDGNITNKGNQTVNAITVAVTFGNDAGEQPQVETVPLLLIRTHQPYIDTEPVSSAPLAPGDTREFRLIFDDISPMWNQQTPAIHVVGVRMAAAS